MLKTRQQDIRRKVCVISGSGNVSQYTAEKLLELGAKVVSFSDSNGTVYDKAGVTPEKLAWLIELKNVRRGRVKEYADQFGAEYREGIRPWTIPCDCAFPSATQNEIDGADAAALLKNHCTLVAEGANMPSTPEAVEQFVAKKIMYGPGKAANAGGVSTSGLEMSQNSMRLSWTREEVDTRLHDIMIRIHNSVRKAAMDYGQPENYVMGANIAGFCKVADAMLDQGLV